MPATPALTRQLLVDQLNHEWRSIALNTPPPTITTISHLDGCTTLDEVLTRLQALGTRSSTPGADDEALLGLLDTHINRGSHIAGRVVLQRMLGRAVSLAQRAYRRQAHADIDALLTMAVAALWDVIATYPLTRRTRRVGANLAMDTLRRFTDLCRRDTELAEPRDNLSAYADTPGGDLDAGIELLDTLAWGVEHDVITSADAAMLIRVYCPPAGTPTSPAAVADELGMTRNAIRQRCSRAIARLAQAAARTHAAAV